MEMILERPAGLNVWIQCFENLAWTILKPAEVTMLYDTYKPTFYSVCNGEADCRPTRLQGKNPP